VSWSQILLAAAIIVVFIAWRRARSQVARMHAEIAAHRDRNTFTLEASDAGGSRMFTVLAADGTVADAGSLDWEEHGLERVLARAEAAALACAPGDPVEIVPDDAADSAGVWDVGLTARLGSVQGESAVRLRERIVGGELGGCIVLREPVPGDGGLELLLIHIAVEIDI
jgi:hypothetical protein